MRIHCFSFRFLWRSIYAVPDFLLYLNTHCLIWKISLFPCGFAVCCSTFHDSLNTYCPFQIFRWGFTTSFRFPWRSIACCSRYPCLLEYSLSALKDFLVSFWIRCLLFHISWFLEYLLPVPDISMTPSYFLKDPLPAAPDFLVYLNTHCLLFKMSLNVHFLSQILLISWKTHHLLQMLKVWVRGGQSCCWHIFVDIFVQSPWHLNQFVDAIIFLDFSLLVG